MNFYAYARVSSKDQNEDRQILEFQKLEITPENIFIDKISGKTFDRENYIKLKDILRKGDLLYITSIDRLGRNYIEIKKEWAEITTNIFADICVIDMPILDTRNNHSLTSLLMNDIIFQILSFVAEQELTNIKSRQAEGIAAAKLKGKHLGRPIITPYNFLEIVALWEKGLLSAKEAQQKLNMPKSTFYYKINKIKRCRIL